MMTLIDARRIAISKFGWDRKLFDMCKAAAEDMNVKPVDMPPMCLAIGIMGLARVGKGEDLSSELTDALALVAKAEKEWRLEIKQQGKLQ